MIIAKALCHCSMRAAIQTEKCIFLSWAALLRCGPLAQPSPARPAQHGPTEPSLGQQLLQIANLSSFFFWQNRNVHDEGRAKWEHWTLLWHSYQQRGSPMHSKVPSLMQIKYIAAANFFLLHQQQMFSYQHTYRILYSTLVFSKLLVINLNTWLILSILTRLSCYSILHGLPTFSTNSLVKCSYGVHKFKPSRQKKFPICSCFVIVFSLNNEKLFLLTGFELGNAVTAFYFRHFWHFDKSTNSKLLSSNSTNGFTLPSSSSLV